MLDRVRDRLEDTEGHKHLICSCGSTRFFLLWDTDHNDHRKDMIGWQKLYECQECSTRFRSKMLAAFKWRHEEM